MDTAKPKKPINEAVSAYFSGLAHVSHGKMKAKYGGEQGYRDHMRLIASKPRKKRTKPYDNTTPKDTDDLPAPSALDGSGRASVGNASGGVK